jgi:hypothetical protein
MPHLIMIRPLPTRWVFPRQQQKHPASAATAPAARVTVHGFRSTFRDWAAERTAVPSGGGAGARGRRQGGGPRIAEWICSRRGGRWPRREPGSASGFGLFDKPGLNRAGCCGRREAGLWLAEKAKRDSWRTIQARVPDFAKNLRGMYRSIGPGGAAKSTFCAFAVAAPDRAHSTISRAQLGDCIDDRQPARRGTGWAFHHCHGNSVRKLLKFVSRNCRAETTRASAERTRCLPACECGRTQRPR